jgi:hypothetical protein
LLDDEIEIKKVAKIIIAQLSRMSPHLYDGSFANKCMFMLDIPKLSHLLLILAFLPIPLVFGQQPTLPDGLEQPRQRIKNTLGGFYSGNVTLFFRNSPSR